MGLTVEELERRRNYIGSSDAPAILGLDPFRSASDIYWSKVTSMPEENKPEFDLGNRLEDVICEWAADQLHVQIQRRVFAVSTGSDGGIMAANFDALVTGKRWALEAKFSSQADEWGEESTDQIPERVLVQTHHQMHVGDLELVWVPALIIGYTAQFRLYCVRRNEDVMVELARREVDFWRQYVETRTPPDGIDVPPLRALKARHREPNSVIELDSLGAERWAALEDAKAAKKAADAREDECKAAVLALFGEAEGGRLPDGRMLTYLEQKSAPRCEYTQLRALHPAIYDEFVTQGTHRVLRVKAAPKTK